MSALQWIDVPISGLSARWGSTVVSELKPEKLMHAVMTIPKLPRLFTKFDKEIARSFASVEHNFCFWLFSMLMMKPPLEAWHT